MPDHPGTTDRRPHILLIANGEPPSARCARRLARGADLILAADGGANAARKLGITPDIIIGDLDSLSPATRRWFSGALLIRVARQDTTDLEKALDHCVKLRAGSVTVMGATGRRMDFTLANISVLWRYTSRFAWRVVDDTWEAVPVGRTRSVRARRGTTVSLIPFGAVRGITLRGLYYPLTNAALRVGEVAVSNVVVASPFRVRTSRGRLLLLLHHPPQAEPDVP